MKFTFDQLAHLIVMVCVIVACVVLDITHDIAGDQALLVILAAAGITVPGQLALRTTK